MLRPKLFLLFFIGAVSLLQAQTDNGVMHMDEFRNEDKREIINIPSIEGYQTLKCDLHMHTVFSDGHVWPDVRVQEAWNEGLDVIAITDHIEYQPHSKDVAVDHNRAYELAKEFAAEKNLVFIKGSEITRLTPPGHFNAIFIGDASNYIEDRRDNQKDKEAILKAAGQKAFIFWNHPGWKVEKIAGSYEWIDFVNELADEKLLGGIEVFNGFSFHKKALDWCLDKGLTVLGTSDIHDLVEHDYHLDGFVHRSMTLVFAKERTASSIREALDAGRTVAWSSKYLAGKEENIRALFDICVELSPSYYTKTKVDKSGRTTLQKYYELKNTSDLYFELELVSGNATQSIVLYPRSSQVLVAMGEQKKLTYEVTTAFIRSNKHLVADFQLD